MNEEVSENLLLFGYTLPEGLSPYVTEGRGGDVDIEVRALTLS